MYRGIAERIVDIYNFNWKNNIRMKETCICSVENIIANVGNFCLVIFITIVLGILQEALVFMGTFAIIRFYSGGTHAKNYTKCILIYLCMLLITISGTKNLVAIQDIKIVNIICILSMVIATIINYQYAGKQIALGEYTHIYRKRTFGIFIILYTFMTMMCILNPHVDNLSVREVMKEIILIQSFALLAQSIALWVGRNECKEEVE